jgi:hypothetical protein
MNTDRPKPRLPRAPLTEEQKARLNDVLAQYGFKPRKKPTRAQLMRASEVLMWLSEDTDDGELRDMIAAIRHELGERIGD